MYNVFLFSFRVSMVQTLNALSGTQDLIVMKYQYHKSLLITFNYFTDGYGDWSSEGCEIDESYNDSQDVVTCFCNHLTSFCILLVSYKGMNEYSFSLFSNS